MEWLAQNWFWVVIGVLFVGMHLFGHGGHGGSGGHGGHGGGHGGDDTADKTNPKNPSGHQH